MKSFLTSIILLVFCLQINGQSTKNPSFEEVLSLQSISNPNISPDGNHVIYQVQTTDWENNRYDREIWISKNGSKPFRLTNTKNGNSTNPKWSPDGEWISFLSNRNEKTQIHVIRLNGGEAFQISNAENGVQDYEWSPNGKQIAFLQSEDKSKEEKKRKETYGAFSVDDNEYSQRQLWLMNFNPKLSLTNPLPEQSKDSVYKASLKPKLLIDENFSVNGFLWSPDGTKIAFAHQPDPLINSFFNSDISIYDITTESHYVLVENKSNDGLISWSPDGKSIMYASSLDNRTSNYYLNNKYFTINLDGRNIKSLADKFDENIYNIYWTQQGIYGIAYQKTKRHIVEINSRNGNVNILNTGCERINGMSISMNGNHIAFMGNDDENLSELYKSDLTLKSPIKLTSSSDQLGGWAYAKSEIISWKSEDGAEIEGVLHKPMDYDPSKKYPLLVAIHGGPTGISTPSPTPAYVYPMIQWLNKGALILRPNYRGSAGYGEEFRSLNVKNLGVGDAWDVLSGVKYLEDKGIIDGDKVGSMGWSQGGYISAFLTTNSNKFKAISVGAGISNWMTYYVNTDIHPFTRQYLKATPWSNKEIYEKTSPMTNINKASTPTLIQHGELDRRVPIANAYELLQGLRDVGVPSKLIVYKGFGHGISKPKERLAAMWHNWQWFAKYIWDEDVEIPD